MFSFVTVQYKYQVYTLFTNTVLESIAVFMTSVNSTVEFFLGFQKFLSCFAQS